ncbi:MAG TPA: glycosyltransferase family 4 protein [Gemmatimonadaceae bacterium]|nr:glycosyltransferase family 4 protein [Gemmatimonadaceae bacterium]
MSAISFPARGDADVNTTAGRRLRVAHVTVTPEFVAKILIHDLRRLAAHSDATIVCVDGEALAPVRAEGFRVINFDAERKIDPMQDVRSIWQLWRILRRLRVDVLHTYAPKGGFVGQIAGALARVPRRIHSCRGIVTGERMPRWKVAAARLADRLTNALADRVLFVSAADLRFSVERGLASADKVQHQGSGIDLAIFARARASATARARIRAELGIRQDAFVALTVGRYVEDKGYREIAAAARELHGAFPRLHFLWVAPVMSGEDGVLPDDFIAGSGLAGVVTRVGMRDDMADLYAAADVLVHASHREGVPRVVMESAAMGLPIIASDIPGNREVVADGQTALFFAVRDAGRLAAQLRFAMENATPISAMAERARTHVQHHFDQDRLSERVWGVYRDMVGDTPMHPAA